MKLFALLSSAMTAGLVAAEERIVNGEIISADTYPFIASLEEGWFHFCGGSLIRAEAPALILTAAHCFESNFTSLNNSFFDVSDRNMYAVFGRDDVQPPSSDNTYTNVSISIAKVHADYGMNYSNETGYGANAFDIAILRLDGAVEGYETVELFADESCCDGDENFTIMGYGADYSGGDATQYFERAYQYNVPLIECQRWFVYAWINNITNASVAASMDFSSDEYAYLDDSDVIVDEGNVCAFSTVQDTCQGDSGGPMLMTSTGQQVGVVSWGVGCASTTPGVYSDVGYFHDWIMAASACLIMDMDNYDQDLAEACDMLCMYEDIECTHYALDIESTSTEAPDNTGSPTKAPTPEADDAAGITSLITIVAVFFSLVLIQ